MVTPAVLAGFGRAQPGVALNQDQVWQDYFAAHFAHSPGAARIFSNAGVGGRHGVVNPAIVDISEWSTEQRMRRYASVAPPLGRTAVTGAMAAAGLDAGDVGLFAVVSCTGYSTPGLDIVLADQLGMAPQVQRLFIGHMGCYAALPGIGAVCDYVVARRQPAVLLCVELPTLHIQPPTRDLQQVVAHALFGDAAAAVAVLPPGDSTSPESTLPTGRSAGPSTGAPDVAHAAQADLTVLDLIAHTDPSTADQMTWEITDQGFRMGLSPRVSEALAIHVADVVGTLLARHGLTPPDVTGWAVHPGGPRILDVVEAELKLPAGALEVSRATLRDHGNCSSATILIVLQEMVRRRAVGKGEHLVAMAFGPGLTLYAALLRG